MMSVELGMKGRAEAVVADGDTAQAMGSGSLPVLATPRMAALMEEAAVNAVQSALMPGSTTVGTRLDVTHGGDEGGGVGGGHRHRGA